MKLNHKVYDANAREHTTSHKGLKIFNFYKSEKVRQKLRCFIVILAGFAGVARQRPPSVMSGFSTVFRFNRLRRLYPSCPCVSNGEKLMSFVHFENSSTPNCDHHILLIMTGNAHKEPCHKLLSTLVKEQ